MDRPTYKDEVYLPTENEPWETTWSKAQVNGYEFFCETETISGPFRIYPYIKIVETGSSLNPYLKYEDLEERVDPPTPIWSTESEELDAWEQYHNLVDGLIEEYEVRKDIEVRALAHKRAVELTLYSDNKPLMRTWQSTGPRNVSTMRELANALNAACDYVEEKNPSWARNAARPLAFPVKEEE
jgi:hypothetical protein